MLTLTWNTTKENDHPFSTDAPIFTYIGEPEAIWRLWYELKGSYKYVTVRNFLGHIVDMEKGSLAAISAKAEGGCLIDAKI